MKIIYNRFIPFRGFVAINLFGILFMRHDQKGKVYNFKRLINHESIHTAQMKEMLYIPFYIWYVIEFIIRLIIYLDAKKAYRRISFEVEAYEEEKNDDYLAKRRHFKFLSYL